MAGARCLLAGALAVLLMAATVVNASEAVPEAALPLPANATDAALPPADPAPAPEPAVTPTPQQADAARQGAALQAAAPKASWWPLAERMKVTTQKTVWLSKSAPTARVPITGAGGLARGGVAPLSVIAFPFSSRLDADGSTLVLTLNDEFVYPGRWYSAIRWPLGWVARDSGLLPQVRGGLIYVRIRK
ncbi:MAG: hypothetical protein J3K34DRAFT_517011 [Monoraphidium minutum]|nr:MAG: hypothetical protein J3K34DRAFT_517011 [Monoraphidium minutum]